MEHNSCFVGGGGEREGRGGGGGIGGKYEGQVEIELVANLSDPGAIFPTGTNSFYYSNHRYNKYS